MSKYIIHSGTIYEVPSDDELMHYGVKGMKWGVRRYLKDKYSRHKAARAAKQDRDNRAKAATGYATTGNRIQSKRGEILTRKTSKYDDPNARKKRIDADIKEADDRVKFYGSKRGAKAAIKDEAAYAKSVNRGKAFMDTLKYGGLGGVAGAALGAATGVGGVAAIGFATPIAVVGAVSAVGAAKANRFVQKHANAQIAYTDDSVYGHDMVVALRKYD